ncbi:unnamed protein product [Somion occarium]|uniref:Fungal-type protein kinase domain-containing protein n=1 Tax=Somion occarium TaxID=3059160 RepID=A0ABP1DY68_9APHY
MYEIHEGIVYLILNDFNTSSVVDHKGEPTGATARHRTGTLPFMAVDILENPNSPHYFKHDIESIFYVAVWCTVKLPISAKMKTSISRRKQCLKNWEEGGAAAVADAKTRLVTRGVRALRFSEEFAPYSMWLCEVARILKDGQSAMDAVSDRRIIYGDKVDEDFDMETSDHYITYDKIKVAMDSGMKHVSRVIPDALTLSS